jgi:hypothetical protein
LRRRLEDRLDLLQRHRRRGGPERHQTLTTTIQWSYDLLSDEEQRAFRWLSTFAGPFGLEDAEAVLGEGSAEVVLGLVERSLLVRPGSAADEYRMLETLRSFARARLDEDEGGHAAAAHAAWAVAFADAARDGLQTTEEERWHEVLERRLPDLARAFRWAVGSGELDLAGRIVADLLDWAYHRVRIDVLAWGRELANHPSRGRERPVVLAAASSHAWMLGEHDLANAYGWRGIEAGGGIDQVDSLPALGAIVDTALAVGDLERAHELCRHAYAVSAEHGMRSQQLFAASGLTLTKVFRGLPCDAELALLRKTVDIVESPTHQALGRYSEAEAVTAEDPAGALELLEQARSLAESVHARLPVGVSLAAETALRGRVGALDVATVEQTVRAIEYWLGSGNENLFVTCLRNVVSLLDRFESHRGTVTLVAATDAHTPGRPSYGAEKDRLDAALNRARAALSPDEFEAAWSEGRRSSLEQAARSAIEELRRSV